jgi:hypothetical protein
MSDQHIAPLAKRNTAPMLRRSDSVTPLAKRNTAPMSHLAIICAEKWATGFDL